MSFKGSQKYKTNTWNRDHIGDYTTKVTSLKMLDTERARVCWTWSGKLGPLPVSATVASTLKLNTLTGKILEHEDDVQLTCNPAAAALYSTRKGLWGTRQRASRLGDRVRSACSLSCLRTVCNSLHVLCNSNARFEVRGPASPCSVCLAVPTLAVCAGGLTGERDRRRHIRGR